MHDLKVTPDKSISWFNNIGGKNVTSIVGQTIETEIRVLKTILTRLI